MKRSTTAYWFLILILFTGWFATPPSLPAVLYVAPGGNDSNLGTVDAPLRTIAKALSLTQSGGVILVRAGTYPQVRITSSGISLIAYSPEHPVIDGGIYLDNISQVMVDGFECVNADGDGIYRLGCVYILGGSDNTVQNMVVHHNTANETNGIKIEDSSHNHILNNTVFDNGDLGIKVIGTAGPSDYNEIGWNRVYENVLNGWDADGIGLLSNVSHTYIHDNFSCRNGDDGIDVWDTKFNIIIGNVACDNILGDGNGFKLGWGGENTVTNNTAYGNRYRGFSDNGGGANYYLNNVSFGNGYCGFESNWRVAGDTRISYFEGNQSYDNGTDLCFGMYSVVIAPLGTPMPTLTPTRTPVVSPTATPCKHRRKRC